MNALLWLVLVSRVVSAQESPSSSSLADTVKPGQLVIVIDAACHEFKGIVRVATGPALTLQGRSYPTREVRLRGDKRLP